MRLNRYLSLCGLGSRRGCEQIILDGRVTVNSKRATELATQVGEEDKVAVDGKPIAALKRLVLAFNKPRGYVCSRNDEQGKQTIFDLLPERYQHLHHVGRLDKESDGLLLLTNDGDLSHRLTHPSEGIEKEYEVRLETPFQKEDLAKLLKGIHTEEGLAKAERVWMQTPYEVNIILKQGLKRQIRLMLYALGYEVERLTRTRIGGLLLKGLPRGVWRELSEHEVAHHFKKTKAKAKPRPRAPRPKAAPTSEDDDHFAPKTLAQRDEIKPRRIVSEKRRTAPSTYKPKRPRGFEHETPSAESKPSAKKGSRKAARPFQRPGSRRKRPGGK